eukprot:scaffold328361_cov28-Attheya_sp.AAC.1
MGDLEHQQQAQGRQHQRSHSGTHPMAGCLHRGLSIEREREREIRFSVYFAFSLSFYVALCPEGNLRLHYRVHGD